MAFKTPLFFDAYLAGGDATNSNSQSFIGIGLNLHDHLVKNASATFFVRADSNALRKIGIFKDDLLMVDKSIKPDSGDAVIAVIDNEFNLMRFVKSGGNRCWLEREESGAMTGFKKYFLDSDNESVYIWGVVTHSIHKLREVGQ
jgi:DNA polymerase V